MAKPTCAADIMTTELFTVTEDRDLNYVEVMSELRNIRHIPVIDKSGGPVGVLSVRDMLEHLSQGGASHFIPVKELMCRNLITAEPSASIASLAHKMLEHKISCVLITSQNRLAGIVTERDFLKCFTAV